MGQLTREAGKRMRYTKAFLRRARSVKLSPTMLDALIQIEWSTEAVWYHDVGAGARTAEALLARGLVEETPAGTAGYLQLTRAGRLALKDSSKKTEDV